MLKSAKNRCILRASRDSACQRTANFCSNLTNLARAISTGFSITSTKNAQMHAAVRLNRFHLQIYAIFAITYKQPTQVSESML